MSAVSQLESLVQRLEAVASKFEGGAAPRTAAPAAAAASAGAAPASSGSADGPAVRAFDDFIQGHVQPFVAAAAAIGGPVQKQAEAVLAAFQAQKNLVATASISQKPSSDADFLKVLQPVSDAIQNVQKLQDNRAKEKNHLAMAANGIDALGWVTISPAPGPFIAETAASAQTFGNKVLMEHRNVAGGEPHVAYVKAYYAALSELQAYVKQYHTTGLVWNPKGGNALSAAAAPAAAAAAAPKPPGGPGGPPPPPPSADFLKSGLEKKNADAGGGGMAGVLAALSKGEGVTTGLKKVTDDMKTKNRSDRSGVVAAKSSASAAAAEPAKPPKFSLEMGGKKWVVEHMIDRTDLEITEGTLQQAVYVYKCNGRAARTVLQVKDKVKIVSLDDCQKTSVVVNGVVASVDVVNCKKCELQINGAVPTLTLDNVNGMVIYLTHPDALNTRIISSKCSEINVVLPKEGDDPTEIAVPEQYETVVVNGKLVTTPVAHVGV